MIDYRSIQVLEINREFFRYFIRRQVVEDCWRRIDGEWVIQKDPFIDEWSEKDYQLLITCLKNTIETGGIVYGAFQDGMCKGFTSVEAKPFGSRKQYLDLSCIHVSEDLRGNGVGTVLFKMACNWAKGKGAEKLYISAHSAVETQAFYHAKGCVDAEEYNEAHVKQEPFDCQMEYRL